MGREGTASSHAGAPAAAKRPPSQPYVRREPEKTLLHKLIRENFETLVAEARSGDGPGLPDFVVQELRDYLVCGVLSAGLSLLECTKCHQQIAVAFSCKKKGFCPSCLNRRMHSVALDLVGRVLPVAPYRHFVLSLPPDLRFLLARDEGLLARLREIFVRSVHAWQRAKARRLGVRKPLVAAVVFTQRFSSRLLIYPHFYAVVPDGVFAEDADGKLVFLALRPSQRDVALIVARIARKAARLLARLDLDSLRADPLDRLRARAAQGELPIKIASQPHGPGRLLATANGFSLQAARHLHANDREGLAFLIRYNLRPPLALRRLSELPNGNVLIHFKQALADGTVGLELEPMALLRRLAALVPPPGSHDLAYFGFLAPNSRWRKRFVRPRRPAPDHCRPHPGLCDHDEIPPVLQADPDAALGAEAAALEPYFRWADLMRAVHGIEVLDCPCGGKRRVVEQVTDKDRIRSTLERLGLWREPPAVARPPRSAQAEIFDRHSSCDGVDPPAPDYASS